MENNIAEQNKNKNLIIGVMSCVIVLLIAILIYYVFIRKEEKVIDNTQNTNNSSEEKVDVNTLKSMSLSTTNQEFKINNKTFKVRIDKMEESDVAGALYVNDKAIISNDGLDINIHAENVYYTNDFIIFTSLGQSDNYITYALDSNGNELKIADQYYQMHDFKYHTDGIKAEGAKCCLADGEPDDGTYDQTTLIIKHENNTITIKPLN